MPAGKCEGRGEGGFRTALPSAARRHRSRLSFSLSLPFSSRSPSRPPSISQFGWLPPSVSSSKESERASESEKEEEEEEEGTAAAKEIRTQEGTSERAGGRADGAKVCSPRVHYLSLV